MYGSQYNPLDSRAPNVPFVQPKSLFRFGEQTIWSSQFLAPGAPGIASTSNRLFSVAQGSQGQGFTNALSIAETNLKEGGKVPAGVAYDVFGVGCQIMHGNQVADAGGTMSIAADTQVLIRDEQNIINNGALSWSFTQTQIDICPVALAGAGGGLFGSVSQNAAGANAGAMNNGNGQIWMYRKHPVALPGNTTFTVLLTFGSRAAQISAANYCVVRCVLFGYYKNIIEIG